MLQGRTAVWKIQARDPLGDLGINEGQASIKMNIRTRWWAFQISVCCGVLADIYLICTVTSNAYNVNVRVCLTQLSTFSDHTTKQLAEQL